jgi:hypothetical protein
MAAIFAYTTVTNIVERPEGIKIATFFIVGIVLVSSLSRAMRSLEIRLRSVQLDARAQRYVMDMVRGGCASSPPPDKRTVEEYDRRRSSRARTTA